MSAPIAAAWLVHAWLAAAPDVTARPEDTRCPRRAAVADALEGRVPAPAAAWSVRYRVEAATPADARNHVWLELRDEQGELRLRRELAIAHDGCEASADGIALIVERFFREVSWTGSVPLPDMERAPEPPPVPLAPPPPWEAQAGAALRRELSPSPGLALALRRRLGPSWVVAAGLVIQPVPVIERPGGAEARLWSLPLGASARRAADRGRWRLELGPQITVSAERRHLSRLETDTLTRFVVAVGTAGSARWATPWSHWGLVLDVSGEVTVVAPAFTVQGVPGAVLAPRRIQLLAVLGVARAFGL